MSLGLHLLRDPWTFDEHELSRPGLSSPRAPNCGIYARSAQPDLFRFWVFLSFRRPVSANGIYVKSRQLVACPENTFYIRHMAKTSVVPIECKSALNRVSGMPFRWSLNPYRGCAHGCHYCYAMATHAYFGLSAEAFASTIFAKTNLAEVLRVELARPAWINEKVAIGTATDPYQPCEGRCRITRAALEVLRERATPISIVTKSTLILRDLDVLAGMAERTRVSVNFSITTLEAATWRLVEPGTPPPWQRLAVMRRLVEAGVRCSVLLAPILPGITDSAASIEAVVRAAKEHGAATVWSSPLRLVPLVKEHYYGFVKESFPDLHPRYERAYAHSDVSPAYRAAIQARVDRIRAAHGFVQDEGSDRDDGAIAQAAAASPVANQLTLRLWRCQSETVDASAGIPAPCVPATPIKEGSRVPL
jgi:DNA repair photolyase